MLEQIEGLKKRRVLADIPRYPTPAQIYQALTESEGWPYRIDKERYLVRDRALVAILYLAALRISEARRLMKSQFQFNQVKKRWEIIGVKLSKVRWKDKPRVHTFREEIWLPITGDREGFTKMVVQYLDLLQTGDLLFPFKSNRRPLQIVGALTGMWSHYFRAQGEYYLYRQWGHDIMAVADYVKVDAATLGKYIHDSYRDKPAV